MKLLMVILLSELMSTYGATQHVTVTCVKTLDDSPDERSRDPPSVLRALSISMVETGNGKIGEYGLVLNISWAINVDQSNVFLVGTWIRVDKDSFLCRYRPPFKEVDTAGYEQLWFHYVGIPAEPGNIYFATAFNLPKPVSGSIPHVKTAQFFVPGCDVKRMKHHESCIRQGSLWEPIMTASLSKDQIQISFTPSTYTKKYSAELWRCVSFHCTDLDEMEFITLEEFNTAGDESRLTKTIAKTNLAAQCGQLHVILIPYFDGCPPVCDFVQTEVNCTTKGVNYIIPLLTVLNAALMVLVLVCLFSYGKIAARSRFAKMAKTTEPISVLIVYPAENGAFQKAVVTLAEFLHSHCFCRVTIDVWQRGKMAEMGLVQWLTLQTQSAEKVIFVCPQRARHEWAETKPGPRDHTVPASADNVFSLALNILASHAQHLAGLHKYLMVHLGEGLPRESLPGALTLCKSFCLMRDLEKLTRCLHGRPSGGMVSFLTAVFGSQARQSYALTKELRDSIQELQWQET